MDEWDFLLLKELGGESGDVVFIRGGLAPAWWWCCSLYITEYKLHSSVSVSATHRQESTLYSATLLYLSPLSCTSPTLLSPFPVGSSFL